MTSSNNYFGDYTLSADTLNKLKQVEKIVSRNASREHFLWATIKQEEQTKKDDQPEDMEITMQYQVAEVMDTDKVDSVDSSTQFFFSQREIAYCSPRDIETNDTGWRDVAESLYEALENCDKISPLMELMNLSDVEIDGVVKYLSTKLSLKGTYNLCHSLCTIDLDRSMAYIKMIFTNLLLQKIIDLREPSRLISSLIHVLVDKFPEDIQEFVYVPMLNVELKDTSAIMAMIDSCPPQRKIELISSFQASVQELQQWHMNILSQLITMKLTDNAIKDKLLNLLSEKASTWCGNKNYGKFILSFMKLNTPFTTTQKSKMSEIVAFNETIFKRGMASLLTNMYFHDDMWHIS